ncbi:hypothetical protein OF829_16130 [Sphingomonas sp. LB-2]|uniref:hypothetical protein n=1 Tax=Sphingomonas caeni TaxID=2984949 RepID=UPI00222F3006|nr:hypothetical protein [Sphingomonas caeni]MCW3848766.1 hypothetical protein [Sphingomonas caeni]
MTPKLRLALDLAHQIEEFPLEKCGPSDDPDKETAYLAAFSRITTRFFAAARRIGDPELLAMLDALVEQPQHIVEAYIQKDGLMAVIDYLKEVAESPAYENEIILNSVFIAPEVLVQLRAATPTTFDFKKLIRFCEELDDAYRRGNYLSSVLLIRAIMNHVPPVFGQQTFGAVVSQAGRSVKPMLERLEHEARPIADLHTHFLIRQRESLPTKNQVEPYKGPFELLLQEVMARAE